MKVLVYYNKEKDAGGVCKCKLIEALVKHGVEYLILEDDMLKNKMTADALFAIGGDGTILFLAEFANKNSIPIIGINAGNLGFLCEFEKSEVEMAIIDLKNGEYISNSYENIGVVARAIQDFQLTVYDIEYEVPSWAMKVVLRENDIKEL